MVNDQFDCADRVAAQASREEDAPAYRAAHLALPALPEAWPLNDLPAADPDSSFTPQRAWLLQRIFARLDKDGDGKLNFPEALDLAHLSGSQATRAMWVEEYALLFDCDLSEGLGLPTFLALMQD
eukprot:5894303-Alexandrium_andersonii.AAC.1